ncbi:hypothetical protein CKAN_01308800 [Cinnamomum micranthum f. kanehirae]|uniref:Uncharacterized protein n=1 Tax=Cinnamomum micranthum f. kanehirae TaxID=337451 RepID=A0A3S3QF83_9MAGN|nr:hypothetical protein CKAN_01308800 [Cinnamomum micranthum f. kanehirae]
MSRSSEYHLGASSSSPPFRQFGELSEEEECGVIAKKKKKATIEQQQQQQQKRMAEGTPLESQNKQEGKQKEEYVTIQRRKEEEYVTIQVEPEPDAPQMQGVAAQSSFNHSGSMAHSESGIMSYAVPI